MTSGISFDNQSNLRSSCSFIYQLPDVVLKRKLERKIPYAETFHGIVLFADVSGFTEMCQKYSSDVQRGVNQLANALNGYMAPIVEAVLREKGDVYKFAGDAVLGKKTNFDVKL
jgi:adenylate cyclase 10